VRGERTFDHGVGCEFYVGEMATYRGTRAKRWWGKNSGEEMKGK
jgi:hypothetical protein